MCKQELREVVDCLSWDHMEDGVRWWEAGMGGEMITDEVDSGYITAQSTLKGYCACFLSPLSFSSVFAVLCHVCHKALKHTQTHTRRRPCCKRGYSKSNGLEWIAVIRAINFSLQICLVLLCRQHHQYKSIQSGTCIQGEGRSFYRLSEAIKAWWGGGMSGKRGQEWQNTEWRRFL